MVMQQLIVFMLSRGRTWCICLFFSYLNATMVPIPSHAPKQYLCLLSAMVIWLHLFIVTFCFRIENQRQSKVFLLGLEGVNHKSGGGGVSYKARCLESDLLCTSTRYGIPSDRGCQKLRMSEDHRNCVRGRSQ